MAPCLADDDDDDGYIPPPFDPGIGFEGILPRPPLPPYLRLDQHTTPLGVRQVFNTPQTLMGQSFTPTNHTIDWVAFVFQNNTQPTHPPGPARLRVSLFSSLDASTGTLGGRLADSDIVSIPSNTTAWLVFTFPESIAITPGSTYFCHLQFLDGHPSWVGGRLHDFYPRGSAFGYLPNPFGGPIQRLDWHRYDLVFAQGTGRSTTGVTPGELLQWSLSRGTVAFDENADPDEDGRSTFAEYLRDTHPADAGEPARSRVHLLDINGSLHVAWTLATPQRLEYLITPEGSVRASIGHALDHLSPADSLSESLSSTSRLVEVLPAVADGLPSLSPFHRYRTFRLDRPVTDEPHSFIINRVSIMDDDQPALAPSVD